MRNNIPPELVFDRPHPSNNFKYCWAICQPDCNWGVLYEGESDSYEESRRKAMYYYDKTLSEMEVYI